jgi:ubiquinone/menaquinone biosynthesis C-methylase UbiE
MTSWLDRNARKIEKPRALLPSCIPEEGGTWADFGCGEGIFTSVLYELVGPECTIHAVDTNRRSLRKLKANFSETHPLANLTIHQADFTQPLALPPLDGFVIANALHFIRDELKEEVLSLLVRYLKPAGRAIVIEYNSRRSNFVVPHAMDEKQFIQLAGRIGLLDVSIASRVPSSFMGEMYAGVGVASSPYLP